MRTTLILSLLVPWLAVVGILLARNQPNLREGISLLAGGILLASASRLVGPTLSGETIEASLGTYVLDVSLAFRADAAGTFFALLVAVLWPIAVIYGAGYMRSLDEHAQGRFFAAFAASIGATLGVAFAANLLTLFVFYELLTVATYPLVVHKETEAARVAGRKYVRYTLTGGVAVLAGTVLLYAVTGSVAFTPGGIAGIASADPLLAQTAFALLIAGFGVKAAVVPLHGWLPDAMVAPTPVSGLLHAVAVVKSGVFGIARVVLYVFGGDAMTGFGLALPLAVLATVTMLLAGVIALKQERLKRGLAYSTISQLSYIVLGLAVLTPVAIQGAFLHVAAHAFMKIVLFFCAGVVYVETHVERIDGLRGIARRMPLTMTMFAIASAGLVGLPLVAGFVSKWYLLTGVLAGGEVGFAAALLAAGLLKLLFFWPLIAAAFSPTAEAGTDRSIAAAYAPATNAAKSDGGHEPGHAPDEPTGGYGGQAGHSGSMEGPGSTSGYGETDHGGGWTPHTWRTESTWLLLAPIAIALLIAVVFGIVPTRLAFFDLAEAVAEVTLG